MVFSFFILFLRGGAHDMDSMHGKRKTKESMSDSVGFTIDVCTAQSFLQTNKQTDRIE